MKKRRPDVVENRNYHGSSYMFSVRDNLWSEAKLT